eukprot:jgi/Mesvir1/18967/Mv18934-RA.1
MPVLVHGAARPAARLSAALVSRGRYLVSLHSQVADDSWTADLNILGSEACKLMTELLTGSACQKRLRVGHGGSRCPVTSQFGPPAKLLHRMNCRAVARSPTIGGSHGTPGTFLHQMRANDVQGTPSDVSRSNDRARCSRVVAVAAPMSPGKSSGNDKAVSTPVVRDAMCRDPIVVTENTPVREALKMLVENNFTGMPVVNAAGECIGVVSDFDLIALDSISGEWTEATSMFPPVTSTWTEFKDLRKVLDKTKGKTVYDVMTKDPVCVRETTNLEVAAKMLLNMKMRRLPVVDGQNKVVGILTRKNVIKEALKQIDLAEK